MKNKIINHSIIFAVVLALGLAIGLGGNDDLQYEVSQYEKYQQELRDNL